MGRPVKFRSPGVVTPKDVSSTYGAIFSLSRARLRHLRKRKSVMPKTRSTTADTAPPIIAPWLLDKLERSLEEFYCVRGTHTKRHYSLGSFQGSRTWG